MDQKSDDVELDRMRTTIEETETRLIHTLNAIQEKFTFDQLVNEASEKFQQAAVRRIEEMETHLSEMSGKIGHNAIEAVKEHPVPVTLLGLSLGWFLLESFRGSSDGEEQPATGLAEADIDESEALYQAGMEEPGGSDYREGGAFGSGGKVSGVVHKAKDAAGGVQEKAGHVAGQIKETVRHLGERVQHRTHSDRGSFSRIAEERPLMLGLAGIAFGTVVGLAFAGAFRERKVLSGARETIRHKAHELVHGTREKAERVVGEAGRAAKEEAERQHLIAH